MARVTGDLWPQGSGTASLGAEQIGTDGFAREIRPFAHIHMNSGVWHEPTRGQSGIIRFQNAVSPTTLAFSLSFDGGKNYPLELRSLPNNWNTLSINAPFGLLNILASGNLIENAGGSLQQTVGTSHTLDVGTNSQENVTAGAKTINANSMDLNSATNITFTVFNSSFLKYKITGPNEAWHWFPSYEPGTGGPEGDGYFPIPHSGQIVHMIKSQGGGLQNEYNFGDEITLGSRPLLTPRGVLLKYPVGARLPKPNDVNNIEPGYGIAVSGFSATPTNISSYALAILAPNALAIRGSGQNSPNMWVGVDNSFNAARIQTSGVLMISALSGIIMTGRTTFITDGTTAEINLSGLFTPPTLANLRVGDMFMMHHSVASGIVGTTTDTVARAKALGVGGPSVQTNSGVVTLRTGSGVVQYLSIGTMQITTAAQIVPFASVYQAGDSNYTVGDEATNNSGIITFMSPGLYKADCKIQAVKLVGTTPQSCRYRLLLNGATLLGDQFNSFHYDTSNGQSQSASLTMIFNAEAGDTLSYDALSTLAGANNCSILNRGGVLVIEKLGPQRGQF